MSRTGVRKPGDGASGVAFWDAQYGQPWHDIRSAAV